MAMQVRTDENRVLDCPHCEQPLTELTAVPLQATLGKRFAYGCSHCDKLLSISHRKGFWMG